MTAPLWLGTFCAFGTAFYTWRAVCAPGTRDRAFHAASAVLIGFLAFVALMYGLYVAGVRLGERSGRNHLACDLHAAGVQHPLVEQYCPALR